MPETTTSQLAAGFAMLRVSIDGSLTAGDFSDLFCSLEQVNAARAYYKLILRGTTRGFYGVGPVLTPPLLRWPPSPFWRAPTEHSWDPPRMLETEVRGLMFFSNAPREASLAAHLRASMPLAQLAVARVSYSSPGSIDLIGIGAVVGHIKDFVLAIMNRRDEKDLRAHRDDREELLNQRLRIENAKLFQDLVDNNAAIDRRELDPRITEEATRTLWGLAANGKLTGCELISENTGDPDQGE